MDELKKEIKETIISALQLEDITPEDIVDSDPLLKKDLGSIRLMLLNLELRLKRNLDLNILQMATTTKNTLLQ